MVDKKRLDLLLLEKGLSKSANEAQAFIMRNLVLVNGKLISKPGHLIAADSEIEILKKDQFVGRGGKKLAHALKEFKVDVNNKVCIDIGASTGGFTDCLLQNGANKVYAIDVGYGQLDWNLRNDPRVVVMEKTNIRNVNTLPEDFSVVVIDVSFISLKLVFPVVDKLVHKNTTVIALIKPQFEAEKDEVEKGGIVRNEEIKLKIIEDIKLSGNELKWELIGITPSPIRGARKGNEEFLICFSIFKECADK